jgi:transposase
VTSMGRILRELGLSRQKGRPSHPEKDPAAQAAFKKSPGAAKKTSVYA